MTLKELQRTPVGTLLLWELPYGIDLLNNLLKVERIGIIAHVTKNEITIIWHRLWSRNVPIIFSRTYDRNDKQDLAWHTHTTVLATPSDR